MEFTRRNFLQTAGTAAALLLSSGTFKAFAQVGTDGPFPLPPETYSQGIYSMTARQFEALRGTIFTAIASGGRTSRLTLTEVNPLERPENTQNGYYGECFSLIFESSQKYKLTQGIYSLSGGGIELGDVLLVPTGLDRKQYELIVNHLTR